MKYRQVLLMMLCVVGLYTPAHAQIPASEQNINLNLTVGSILPPSTRDWGTSDDNAVLTISNEKQGLINARIDVQIRIGDTIYARSRPFNMPTLQITHGVSTYTASQIFSSMELEYYRPQRGEDRDVQNKPLPSGSYILCLQLIEEDGSKPVSLPICRGFSVMGTINPILHRPGRVVDLTFAAEETMEFRWELPFAISPAPARWILRIVEANTAGNDSLDLITGTVILERIVRDSTRFILTAPSSFFTPERRYLWSVRPMETISNGTANNTSTGTLATSWAVPLAFTVMRAETTNRSR